MAIGHLLDVEESGPAETVRKGRNLLSNRTGIIRRVASEAGQAGDPRIYSFGVHVCDTSVFHFERYEGRSGGAGLTIEEALAATIGEVVERYCAAFYDRRQMVVASYRDVADIAVHPSSFVLFSEEQYEQKGFPFQRFTEESKISWTWGYSITQEREVLLPACLVYLPYRPLSGEPVIGYSTSTGMAAGNTLEEAILSGIYEVVERDAFTVFWLRMMRMPLVEPDSETIQAILVDRFSNGSWFFVETTNDLAIPSFFCLYLSMTEFGLAPAVGSASRLKPEKAILKTIVEVGQARPYFRYELARNKNWKPARDFSNVVDFEHHAIVYLKEPSLISVFNFFIDQENEIKYKVSQMRDYSTGRILGDIRRCVEMLGNRGYETIVVDLTTPDIGDVGLYAVRVMVPGLVPLHGNHNYPFLGSRRLEEVPKIIGRECADGINPYPHPFP